ncbi:MAG TPA: translocation/assembly module TamB domain-containing protein [Bacteroidales bacterium]|nr:translocation/assembly module TamB domain-containing protein [Bacteroidales bacterium]
MGIVIKKWIRIVVVVMLILIAIPVLLYSTIQIPAVQTIVVREITRRLSEKLQSEISIGRVDYHFFNKIALGEVLFLDRNRDTLLYAEKISAGLRKVDLKGRIVGLGKVNLTKPEFALITDSTGTMNLNWYLEQLRSEKKDSTAGELDFSIDRVDITGGHFSLLNRSAEKKESRIKVDFSDMAFDNLNGTVEDFRIEGDTTSFSVYDLSFIEKSGFRVKRMRSNVILSGSDILLESALINCDTSTLNLNHLAIKADSPASFGNFIEEVKLDVSMGKSMISTADLRYFAPLPENLDESVVLSGKFTGTVAELRGRNVNIEYGKRTFLDCDFDISGLPDINNAFIYLGFNDFRTNATDLREIPMKDGRKITLPAFLYKLGDITFDGSFSGFTTDFVTYGEFTTSKGDVRTDISLRPEKDKRYRMQGLISANNIDLKELSGSEILGKLSIHANIDGNASSFRQFEGNVTGLVDSIEVNGYNYRKVDINGKFTEKTWDGSINMADENIRLDLLGMFNFNDTLPEFDFTLNLANANLYRLNIDKKDSTSALTMLLTSNFKGNSIDNLDGEIKLLNSDITRHGKTIELYDFSIRTFSENNRPALSLRTDFVDATVRGNYNFEGLRHFIRMTVSNLMPSITMPEKESEEINHNDFSFEVNFKNTDRINDFFRTGLLIAEKSYVKGTVAPDTLMHLEGRADYLSYKNIRFNNLDFFAGTSGPVLKANFNTSSLSLPGETDLKNFNISLRTKPDTFYLKTDWDNKEEILNRGLITMTGSVSENPGRIKYPILRIDIDSSTVYAGNNRWKIDQSSVLIDSNAVDINNIHVSSGAKFYHAEGSVSHDPSDTLHLEFRGIDISPLNHLGENSKDSTRLKMDLAGQLNGKLAVTGVFGDLLLESDIIVLGFSMLGSEYGDISINSEFDNIRRVVDVRARNSLNGRNMFDVRGYYDPADHEVNVGFTASRLPVDALNPLLRSFASGISGFATGKLRLTGLTNNLVLSGAVKAENVKMKINYLQTSYILNDSVRFDSKGFRFNNVRFTDEEGKPATISGTIFHRNFRNYTADLTINMSNNFLVLNTQYTDNPSFYGKVYASGVTRIKTSPDLLSFDISARTGSNTKFFIPLTDELSVAEYSFVNFINPAEKKDNHELKIQEPKKQLGIDLNIDLTVTPDAVAELIFDEKVGDKITGSGSGILNISMNPKGIFQITGDYTIEKGTYLFTLGNIVNKRFDVENGGRINFNGNLDDAEIELKATYQKFSASLFPLTQDVKDQNSRYAVEPQILLSGRLFNPTVKFEINLPNADEQAKTNLRNAIASDEVLSRQFMYLLVTNSFYSEQTSAATSGYSGAGTSAMAATTFEMISNQLSNWISQINENFNLGLNYRPGSGDKQLDPDEVQVAFETQVLDDRVVLNGNFDYRTSSGSAERLTGDFEAELKITDKLRFKVFNRFNDTYLGTKGPYTQGIGIFYREDFDKLSDLFRKKEKTSAIKQDEVTLKDVNQTSNQ